MTLNTLNSVFEVFELSYPFQFLKFLKSTSKTSKTSAGLPPNFNPESLSPHTTRHPHLPVLRKSTTFLRIETYNGCFICFKLYLKAKLRPRTRILAVIKQNAARDSDSNQSSRDTIILYICFKIGLKHRLRPRCRILAVIKESSLNKECSDQHPSGSRDAIILVVVCSTCCYNTKEDHMLLMH
eukprot:sb/3471534/